MKRLMISLVTVVAGVLGAFAQTSLVATLSHGATTTPYYGVDALKEAYEAAVEGDCITLSSGTFNTTDIGKCITIRGAGMYKDDALGVEPTVITGNTHIIFPETPVNKLTIETVQFESTQAFWVGSNGTTNKNHVVFNKCKFNAVVQVYDYVPSFNHCVLYFAQNIYPAIYFNSLLTRRDNSKQAERTKYYNCTMGYTNNYSLAYAGEEIHNCILYQQTDNSFNSESYVYNSVVYTRPDRVDQVNKGDASNYVVANTDDFFKAGDMLGSNSLSPSDYQLSDAAKTTYLGDDGTQVGMFGGTSPFDATPTIPRISKFAVSANEENGQLKIKLNVE